MAGLCSQILRWQGLVHPAYLRVAKAFHLHIRQKMITSTSLLHNGHSLATASSTGTSDGLSLINFNQNKEPESNEDMLQDFLASLQNQNDERTAELERAIKSFFDMGFNNTQIMELFSFKPKLKAQQRLEIISELVLFGLDPGPVCKILKNSPGILGMTVKQLKNQAGYLRRLGLEAGHLRHVVNCCPDIFVLKQQQIEAIVCVLKKKCLFTVEQVTEILHTCPRVLHEDPNNLEYKFQYAYFRMGIQQPDIVRTKLLQYPITKIKQRHIFLERLGLYQTPDKKRQTQICNPKVMAILKVSEAEFLTKTARSSSEEFEIFKKLLAREEEEECEDSASEEEDSDLEDEEESFD
ncbi:transcription termination factor 4, mitochondrial [Tachyglossus aculeatus]|uniref:transcription termination factor 4, mitochondrial n=1 Tax=Tachyglossus aculeatus TaxID=9261 RepID=UPI0018F42DD9|nr:transcription termination factor 4, mitochondrial [Tachyglossus aculeatus]